MMPGNLYLNRDEPKFRITKYPIFSLSLGYVWFEFVNPIIAASIQFIPKIPNSAFAIILCWITIPKYLRRIPVPVKPVWWAIPFLLIATINLPFIEYEQTRSMLDLISTWFWVLLLTPLMIRVLSTPSGRLHYVLFTALGTVIMAVQFLLGFMIHDFVYGAIELSRHHLAAGVISVLPIAIGYFFYKRGITRYIFLITLGIIIVALIPSGARSGWIICTLELVIMLLILPKSRTLFLGTTVTCFIFILLSIWNVHELYPTEATTLMDQRWRKTIEWQEDDTVWKRLGMIEKTKMILRERPLMGIGYSNRSFASFDAGDVDFYGHRARIRQIDAHNTFLNILGGTGVMGFLAFLYYMIRVFRLFRYLPRKILYRLDCGPFVVSVVGLFIWYLFSTVSFTEIIKSTSILIAVFVFAFNSGLSTYNIRNIKRVNRRIRW